MGNDQARLNDPENKDWYRVRSSPNISTQQTQGVDRPDANLLYSQVTPPRTLQTSLYQYSNTMSSQASGLVSTNTASRNSTPATVYSSPSTAYSTPNMFEPVTPPTNAFAKTKSNNNFIEDRNNSIDKNMAESADKLESSNLFLRSNSPDINPPVMRKPKSVKIDIGQSQKQRLGLNASQRSQLSGLQKSTNRFNGENGALTTSRSFDNGLILSTNGWQSGVPAMAQQTNGRTNPSVNGDGYRRSITQSAQNLDQNLSKSKMASGLPVISESSRSYQKLTPGAPQKELFSSRVESTRFNGRLQVSPPKQPTNSLKNMYSMGAPGGGRPSDANPDPNTPSERYLGTVGTFRRTTDQNPVTFSFMPGPTDSIIQSVNWDLGKPLDSEGDYDKKVERWRQMMRNDSEVSERARSSIARKNRVSNGYESDWRSSTMVPNMNLFYERESARNSIDPRPKDPLASTQPK